MIKWFPFQLTNTAILCPVDPYPPLPHGESDRADFLNRGVTA